MEFEFIRNARAKGEGMKAKALAWAVGVPLAITAAWWCFAPLSYVVLAVACFILGVGITRWDAIGDALACLPTQEEAEQELRELAAKAEREERRPARQEVLT